ncbi:MAG: tetratricopeptide repeat protein [Prevotella sp.]|nr:tetratricopeptide repeat protein [Prevotella sp.]
MNLEYLIKHPEMMDKETLYDLRALLAQYPYYQTARLLMLQNLYLLHDTSFDEELRQAAIYITDSKVIFNLIEAGHYKLRNNVAAQQATNIQEKPENRTISLIDRFLNSLPEEGKEKEKDSKHRKPTPADAAVDYVAYLLETGAADEDPSDQQPLMKGQNLIDNFINNQGGNFELKENPEFLPQIEENDNSDEKDDEEGYFTETLARIYIKQGRYSKALEIIKRLNLIYPKKNAYFADQIRFLEKLIINNNKNK